MIYITINVEDPINAADACREVANEIENGYTNGIIGFSGDTWSIDEDEDEG